MSTPPPSPAAAAPPRPGRRAIAVFAITALLLLAVDLGLKTSTFARVAGVPVDLTPGAEGVVMPIPSHPRRPVVPGVLALHLTANEGAVFGIGRGGRWIFIVFSIVATAVIVTVFARSAANARLLHLALAAVLAGAVGNLYDRVRFGVVRDMLLLFPETNLPFGWSWPDGSRGLYPWIFNIADVCLVVGLIVLMILMSRKPT